METEMEYVLIEGTKYPINDVVQINDIFYLKTDPDIAISETDGEYHLKEDMVKVHEDWYDPEDYYNIERCEETDQYEFAEDVVCAYYKRGRKQSCLADNCVYYHGEYYHNDYLGDNNLCIDYRGEIASLDEVYYWDSDGEYHYEEEEEMRNNELFSYHGETRKNYSDGSEYTVGFEIEKGEMPYNSFNCQDLYNNYGMIMEEDGSVTFELVTPTYNLFDPDLERKLSVVKDIIDTPNISNCGGHIHFGIRGESGTETFHRVKGWLPLLYGMYRGRFKNGYCRGKSSVQLESDRERTQAVNIISNHIEFRIFSGVPDFKTLIWRMEFLREMVTTYLDADFFTLITAILDETTSLSKHMRKVYADDEKMFKMLESAVKFFSNLEKESVTDMESIINEAKIQKGLIQTNNSVCV